MLEALIQATAIANYGNFVLVSKDATGAADHLKGLDLFAGVEVWDFERCTSRGRPVSLASLPSLWFRRLLNEDVLELKLALGRYSCADLERWPDPVRPQIGIHCEGNAGIEIWHPEWRVTGYRNGEPRMKCIWSAERCGRLLSLVQPDGGKAISQWEIHVQSLASFLVTRAPIWKPRLGVLLNLSSQGNLDMGRYKGLLPPNMASPIAKLCCANAIRTHVMLSSADFIELRNSMASNDEFRSLEARVLQSIATLLEEAASLVSSQASKRAA